MAPKQLESSADAFSILNVDFLNGDYLQYPNFLAMVLSRVPVHPWSAMVVAMQSKPVFVSLCIAKQREMEFKDIMHSFLNTSYAPSISFHLQLDTDVETTQGLVCKRPLFAI